MTVIFRDTFTGAADTVLDDHAPDIAPAGFAYSNSTTAPLTDIKLDGTGHAVTVPVGYGTHGVTDPTVELNLTLPFTITLIGRASDTLDSSATLVRLRRMSDLSYIELAITMGAFPDATGIYRSYVYFENNAVGGGWFFAETGPSSVKVERSISLHVEETQVTASFNGVPGTPVPANGAAISQFDRLELILDYDHPTDNSYLDFFEISDTSEVAAPATNPALPPITVPSGTPVFLAEGHAINEQSVYAQVPYITGHSRARRVLTVPVREVSAFWLFEADEMAAIDDWYENTLLAGARQFSVQVRNQGSGPALLWWAARWIEFSTEMLNLGRGRAGGRLLLVGEGSEDGPELGVLEMEINCALLDIRSIVYLPAVLATEISVALQQQPQQLAMEVLVALVEDYLPSAARLTEDGELRETEDGDMRFIN